MDTLCIDVDPIACRFQVLGAEGKPSGARKRVLTPTPCPPDALIDTIRRWAERRSFGRIGLAFPGTVSGGVVRASSLAGEWTGVPLAEQLGSRFSRPARVAAASDAAGLAVIDRSGVELVLQLDVELGTALFVDGRLVPNVAMQRHRFRKGRTYGERLCDAARAKSGDKRWNERVHQAVAALADVFSPRRIWLVGANARLVDRTNLPDDVHIGPPEPGLAGALRLWDAA